MKEDKYIKRVSSNKFFRFMAWVAIIVIIGLLIATMITGIMGSEYFLGFLVLSILAPVFVFAVLTIGRVLYNANEDNNIAEELTDSLDDANKK